MFICDGFEGSFLFIRRFIATHLKVHLLRISGNSLVATCLKVQSLHIHCMKNVIYKALKCIVKFLERTYFYDFIGIYKFCKVRTLHDIYNMM